MSKGRSFLSSVKWAYIGNWGDRTLSAIFTFTLAALLGPHDFGVVSIGIIYVSFLQVFLDQGLSIALIQRKQLEPEHLDAVFWSQIALGVVLTGISGLVARHWAAVNHASDGAAVFSFLSLSLLFRSASIVQTAMLTRSMEFRSLSLCTNAAVVLSGISGLGLAFAGFGIWAIVAQQLVREASLFLLIWRVSPWRPRFRFSMTHLRDLLPFSVPTFVAQLGSFADSQAGMIVLGLLFGPVAVGLYRLAERIVNTVIATAMTATQSVSLPEFTRQQDNPEALRASVLTCFRLGSSITVPMLAGILVVSAPLMATIGPSWAPAADALKVLGALGVMLIFTYFTGPLMQALAKTRKLAVLEWTRTAVGLSFLFVLAPFVRNASDYWQVLAIAVARFAAGALYTGPIFLLELMRACQLPLTSFLRSISPSVIAALGVIAAVLLFQLTGWLGGGRPLLLLLTETAIGGAVGLTILLRLDFRLRASLVSMSRRTLNLSALPGS